MCHHWQAGAAHKLYEELKDLTLEQVESRKVLEDANLAKALADANEYHKDDGGFDFAKHHGFFSGNVLAGQMFVEICDNLIKQKKTP